MKPVKNFVFAVLLSSVLAVSAFAGDQGTPAVVAPPPPPDHAMSTSDEGIIPVDGDPNAAGATAEASDYLFFEALAALLSVY
jgi:hypothetical protein